MNYRVPHDFILRMLYPVRPTIKKMMGCYALMQNNTLLALLRERENQPEFNGVFIATDPIFYDELSKEIHASNMEFDLDGVPHSYIFISEDLDEFKEKVQLAAELIKKGDKRIGKQIR